jgi:hypothetical protein
MGSQTNRNLLAKFDKSKAQRIEAGAREYSKPAYAKTKAVEYPLPPRVTRIENVRESRVIEATIGTERLAMVRVTERKFTRAERAAEIAKHQHRICLTHW